MRVQAWHQLAIITLRAEFPDFEICNAFAISASPDVDGGKTPPHLEWCCHKLAQAMGLDGEVLQKELPYVPACPHHSPQDVEGPEQC